MFNFSEPLFIRTLVLCLMSAVAGGEGGLAVGWSMGVKDLNIENGFFVSSSPEAVSRNV